ncbi:MAG: MarR family transcriptional regulator [Phycisphaerales bacterium]|nr:MarR family transcriptional regulator [Phycisphaerales bacterium]
MPRPPVPSDPRQFTKVRRDHSNETAEDYCEAIAEIMALEGECRVRDLARFMRVTHVTVTKIVGRLSSQGLVTKLPRCPIELTKRGAHLARASRQRHATVLEFLRLLGVPEADAARDAEGIEHHAGERTLRQMRRFVAARGKSTPAR